MDKIKKRKRIYKLILLVIIIILGYFTYLFLNSPKIKFIKHIYEFNGYRKNINSQYENLFNNQKLGFKSNNIITLKDAYNMTSDIFPININIEYVEDNSPKENYLNLVSRVKNQQFINLISTNKNNKLYYTLNNIYDNYYYLDSNYISLFKNSTIDNNIKEAIIKTAFKQIKNKNFYKTSSSDTLNDNTVTLTKTSLSLYTYEIKNVLNYFKGELSTKNAGGNYNYILKSIDGIVENIDTKDNTKYIYSLYEGKNGIVKQDLQIINAENKVNMTIAYYDYDNKNGFKIINNNTNVIDILVSTLDNNKEIKGTIGTNYNINGKIDLDKILITIKDPKEDNIIKIDGDITSKEIKKDSEYNKIYDIDITYSMMGKIVFLSNIKSNCTLTNNMEIKKIDLDKAIDGNKITKEDSNNLTEELLKHEFLRNFVLINQNNATNNKND